jgi:hypothetical protein
MKNSEYTKVIKCALQWSKLASDRKKDYVNHNPTLKLNIQKNSIKIFNLTFMNINIIVIQIFDWKNSW